jgi:hypothetical protein
MSGNEATTASHAHRKACTLRACRKGSNFGSEIIPALCLTSDFHRSKAGRPAARAMPVKVITARSETMRSITRSTYPSSRSLRTSLCARSNDGGPDARTRAKSAKPAQSATIITAAVATPASSLPASSHPARNAITMPTTVNAISGPLWGANRLMRVRRVPLCRPLLRTRWPRKRHLAPTRNEGRHRPHLHPQRTPQTRIRSTPHQHCRP